MNAQRKALLEEANSLGLEFAPNVKNAKLGAMIAEAKGEPVPLDEPAPKGPKVKAEPKENKNEPAVSAKSKRRQQIADAKRDAFKTQVVTITNKDNRENDIMTTVYLSFENQHFGLSKLVPLDIPVELEVALIHIAENTMITLHKDEIVNGKRTGNKTPVRTSKFAISYGKPTD